MSGVQQGRELVAKAVYPQPKISFEDVVDGNDLVHFLLRRDIDKTLVVLISFRARGLQNQLLRLQLGARAQLFATIRCRAPHFVYGWPARRRHGVLQKSKFMRLPCIPI